MTEMISNFPHFIIFEREEVSKYICSICKILNKIMKFPLFLHCVCRFPHIEDKKVGN